MARYVNVLSVVDDPQKTFGQIQQYLQVKSYKYRLKDGEQVFQKGTGFWTAPSFIKVTYKGSKVQVEAWIETAGSEQDLSGFWGWAVKGAVKKAVSQVETILAQPGVGYVPPEETVAEEPAAPRLLCVRCGTPLVTGGICPNCSASAVKSTEQDAVFKAEGADGRVTIKEFRKHYAGEKFNRELRVLGILSYVLSGIIALSVFTNPFVILDLAIYLGLTLGMHLGKSKGCAIAILVYSLVGCVSNLILMGMLTGWGWIVISIWAIVVFNNTDKRYKQMMESL